MLSSLLRPGYWFSLQAIPLLLWSRWMIFSVMIALLVCAIVLSSLGARKETEKSRRRILRRFAHVSGWAGTIGLILLGLTWIQVPILSMRFFFVVWFLGFGYWAWTILRYMTRELPLLNKRVAERAAYEKWLPKPKK